MKRVHIERFAYSPLGTLGVVRVYEDDGAQISEPRLLYRCFSVEAPWEHNRRFISCIPEGTFLAIRKAGLDAHMAEWALVQVPGRDGITFHVGHTLRDLKGGIALGMHPLVLEVDRFEMGCHMFGVGRSREAVRTFHSILRYDEQVKVEIELTRQRPSLDCEQYNRSVARLASGACHRSTLGPEWLGG